MTAAWPRRTAINISTFHPGQIWAAQHALIDPEKHISEEQFVAISRWVLDHWDARDGAQDGVIEDPRQVVIDYAAVQVAAGLTGKQLDTLRALYRGPVNAAVPTADDELYVALEEAVAGADLREHLSVAATVSYRFTHALFRQALYEELIAPRRIRLH